MKYHLFTTSWNRTTPRGRRHYFHTFDTEREAIAHAREKEKAGAVDVVVYESAGDTDATVEMDGRLVEHVHKSKILRYDIPF